MYEDGKDSRNDSESKHLISRFNQMLDANVYEYFESCEIETIIDYYCENINKTKVRKAFDLYEKLFPFSSHLKIKKAQILIYFGNAEQAFKVIQEVAPQTHSLEYLFTLATIHSKLDKPKQAIAIFEQILELNPKNDEVISCLANEYQKVEDFQKSVNMLERLLQMKNYNDLNWYSYIITCEIANCQKRAINFIKKHISKKPYDYEAWFFLGILYQRMDNHLDAIDAFDYCICIEESFTRAYTNKAESLSELGYYYKAIECCKESIKFEQADALLYFDIGELYEKLDNLNKAKSYFYKCIKKDENFSEAWYNLALILDLQGMHLDASYHIKKAVQINKSNVDYLFVYAQIHEKVGFVKEAELAYRKVLEIDQLDSESWLNYSHLLYNNESVNEAIKLLQEGLKLNPKNAELSYRLSAYLLQNGEENQALSTFKDALQLDYDLHKELFQFFPSIKNNKNLLHLLTQFKK